MLKTFLSIIILLLSTYNYLFAITIFETMQYGSSTLICKKSGEEEHFVRYWGLGKKEVIIAKNKVYVDTIIDKLNFKNYTLDECEIFYCSFEPDDLKLCTMKQPKKKKELDVERYKRLYGNDDEN